MTHDGVIQWRRRAWHLQLHAFAGMSARISMCGMAHRSKMRYGPGADGPYDCLRCATLLHRFGPYKHVAQRARNERGTR